DSRTGAWVLQSGTCRNTEAGSHVSDPARSRLTAWEHSRPSSDTVLYQTKRMSPFGQAQTVVKWFQALKIGPQVFGGSVGVLRALPKSTEYGFVAWGLSLGARALMSWRAATRRP